MPILPYAGAGARAQQTAAAAFTRRRVRIGALVLLLFSALFVLYARPNDAAALVSSGYSSMLAAKPASLFSGLSAGAGADDDGEDDSTSPGNEVAHEVAHPVSLATSPIPLAHDGDGAQQQADNSTGSQDPVAPKDGDHNEEDSANKGETYPSHQSPAETPAEGHPSAVAPVPSVIPVVAAAEPASPLASTAQPASAGYAHTSEVPGVSEPALTEGSTTAGTVHASADPGEERILNDAARPAEGSDLHEAPAEISDSVRNESPKDEANGSTVDTAGREIAGGNAAAIDSVGKEGSALEDAGNQNPASAVQLGRNLVEPVHDQSELASEKQFVESDVDSVAAEQTGNENPSSTGDADRSVRDQVANHAEAIPDKQLVDAPVEQAENGNGAASFQMDSSVKTAETGQEEQTSANPQIESKLDLTAPENRREQSQSAEKQLVA